MIAQQTLEIIEKGTYKTKDTEVSVKQQIALSVENTVTLTPEATDRLIKKMADPGTDFTTEIVVESCTTIESIRREQDSGKLAALNFASAKNPGGGFKGGATAQEESLARSSSLHASIWDSEMYTYNRSQETFLYSDYMIYSPQVLFWMDDEGNLLDTPLVADIITSPAPNKNAMFQHNATDQMEQIEPVFKKRIEKVLALALENNVECLILGAWGCGVFRNEPKDVARYFSEVIENKFKNKFRKIVFAITDRTDQKLVINAFKDVFAPAETTVK